MRELLQGEPLESIFATFDEKPLGAASIAPSRLLRAYFGTGRGKGAWEEHLSRAGEHPSTHALVVERERVVQAMVGHVGFVGVEQRHQQLRVQQKLAAVRLQAYRLEQQQRLMQTSSPDTEYGLGSI